MDQTPNFALATFAVGCFWCIQKAFDDTLGVAGTLVGYAGGKEANPTYEEVSSHQTGHRESIQITYDPGQISYQKLLDIFWSSIDPTDPNGQFVDQGPQYRTAIFYHSLEQKEVATQSKNILEMEKKFSKPIVTEILPYTTFYPAEEYHQQYYKKSPLHYASYHTGSGRDEFFKEHESIVTTPVFIKPSPVQLQKTLTPQQYQVTQEQGTEAPFQNAYRDNKRDGLYVDIVSGEPLFLSLDKFDSGTGRPSFSKAINDTALSCHRDTSHDMERTEIKSQYAGSHLGHVFDEPSTPTGKYYCVNSAAMNFIPKEDLEKRGYGQFLKYFEQQSH